jgi:general L-amino acid transport system permease protein
VLDWAVFSATWSGEDMSACTPGGACWVFLKVRVPQFIYGFYPVEERWRVDIAAAVVVVVLAFLMVPNPWRRTTAIPAVVAGFAVCTALVYGGLAGLVVVPTWQWGGLVVNVMLALSAGLLAPPLGLLLALGRRSHIAPLAWISRIYIEVWRGLPALFVLFAASVMLPLMFPSEAGDSGKLTRTLIALVIITSAFQAEVFRSAFQAIPSGQEEAGKALGLSRYQRLRHITLPQAFRLAIPGLVNETITATKNTTLVITIGLLDMVGMVNAAATDPKWLGMNLEGYAAAGAVFWLAFFGLSIYARRLERKLSAGHAQAMAGWQ